MRDYGKVQTEFWEHPGVRQLSSEGKLLYVYLLTGPHTNMAGCFKAPTGYVADDLGWVSDTVSKGFAELSREGFATFDESSRFVLVHRFLKFNQIANPKMAIGMMKWFREVPDASPLKASLAAEIIEYVTHLPADMAEEAKRSLIPSAIPYPERYAKPENREQRTEKEKSFALVAADATPGEGKVSAEDVRVAFGLWNDMAKRSGLAVAKDFTDDRKRKIGVKLRLVGMDGWRSVLETIEASDFCRGGGERGWRITLDNLFQAKTWNTLRDGGYGAVRGGPAEFKPEVWAQLVGMWRSGEPWPEEAGPAPDQPGTRVPKELLVQQVRGAA